MPAVRSLSACLALAGAVVVWMPTRSEGFVIFGDTLDLTQRDFRIWNNFSDPSANDNLVPDPDFPGALGAELAIWKGIAEWGSAPHGSGRTDPSQAVIGSGASNFDAIYSGQSTDAGPKNSNVVSELFGSSFIYAFTEIPIRDGWRIRYYSIPHVWNDGPGIEIDGGSDGVDIQGVAAHEYGHALGLDHSADPTATMYASLQGKGIPMRSIEGDDVAGVQYLYGVTDPAKPRILGYEIVDGGIVLNGTGFHPTNNEVWFTHGIPVGGPDGDPVRVTGVAAGKGGRSLHVVPPPAAGPGEVMVRVPGKDFRAISNAFPFDPEHQPTPPPVAYGAGKVSSVGLEPRLEWRSLPSTRIGTFRMDVLQAMPNQVAVLFSSPERSQTPFAGHWLLVDPEQSERELVFTLSFLGDASLDVPIPAGMIGTSQFYQVWFKDPGDAFQTGLTNGVHVVFQP